MTAIPLLILILVLTAGTGCTALRWLGIEINEPRERLVYAIPIGLGVIAHLVLLLGLAGLLSKGPISIGLILLGLASIPGFQSLNPAAKEVTCVPYIPSDESLPKWIKALSTFILALVCIIVLVYCFVPPGAHEWDALSYHLAAPKIFIQHHRIIYLPTDHHSNFPFTMEMLFTAGLLFQGYVLA